MEELRAEIVAYFGDKKDIADALIAWGEAFEAEQIARLKLATLERSVTMKHKLHEYGAAVSSGVTVYSFSELQLRELKQANREFSAATVRKELYALKLEHLRRSYADPIAWEIAQLRKRVEKARKQELEESEKGSESE